MRLATEVDKVRGLRRICQQAWRMVRGAEF